MTVVTVIWSLLYNSPQGVINSIVAGITFEAVREVNWLLNPLTAFPAIMLLSIWQGAGYQMLIFLAGLQSIPAELYEAASIDGATPWQQFWRVTLPHHARGFLPRPSLIHPHLSTAAQSGFVFARPGSNRAARGVGVSHKP